MSGTARQRVRALGLAVALSAVGVGVLVGPAHAAPTPSSSPTSSTPTSSPPATADREDQDAVDSLWRKILDTLGLGQDGEVSAASAQAGRSQDEQGVSGDDEQAGRSEDEQTDSGQHGQGSGGGNPFAVAAPFADPDDALAREAAALSGSDPEGSAALARIAEGGVALWVGDWTPTATVAATVRDVAQRAQDAGRTAVVVTYAIPGRDCGSYSAGGLSADAYGLWVQQVAAGVQGTGAAAILEPDAIAQTGQCDGQGDRLALLHDAVDVLTEAGANVYLDAGNSSWTGGQVQTIAQRLREAGVQDARGFAVDVSNFGSDQDERVYARALSAELGGAHWVVDTSRNGAGGSGEWCNPASRELGKAPGAVQDGSGQDANLWIKRAGESDGTCKGGPAAGQVWPAYAVDLTS